jgi:hypothetical protein
MPDEHLLHTDSANTRISLLEAAMISSGLLATERWKAHHEVHRAEGKVLEDTKEAMNNRLEGMNQLREENAKFITRAEYTSSHKSLDDRVDTLARLVYIGLGIVLLAGLVIGWLVQHTAQAK